MQTAKQARIAAAVLILIVASLFILQSGLNAAIYGWDLSAALIGSALLTALPYLVVGIGLLLVNVKFSITGVGFVLLFVWNLYSTIRLFLSYSSNFEFAYMNGAAWFGLFASVIGGTLLLFGCLFAAPCCFLAESGKDGLKRGAVGLRKAAFVFFLLYLIITILLSIGLLIALLVTIIDDTSAYMTEQYILATTFSGLFDIVCVILFFIGATKATKALTYQPKPETAPINPVSAPQAVEPAPVSVAEELKQYKELLDSGILTQEEFDAKKKQLLGL